MAGMSSKTSSKKPRPSKTRTCWLQWCINHGNCAMIHSPGGVRPTRSHYRQKIPCAQWMPRTCTLTEYDSCVTFHKLYTQLFHTLNDTQITPKSEYYSGIVAKRESVPHCSSEFRKKVPSKNKNAGKKHGLWRLKSTFLFIYDPIVLFCFQNSTTV